MLHLAGHYLQCSASNSCMIQDNNDLVQPLLFLMLSKNFEEMISFVMPVRPSVRMQQLGSHWMDFHEN
jgi:ABC-type thiamine transport system substrate-binding protein